MGKCGTLGSAPALLDCAMSRVPITSQGEPQDRGGQASREPRSKVHANAIAKASF